MLSKLGDKRQLNIIKYEKLSINELRVYKAICEIIDKDGNMWLERYIPLKMLIYYIRTEEGIEYSIRQIRYIIDKLIKRELIQRRIVYKTREREGKKEPMKTAWFKRVYKPNYN